MNMKKKFVLATSEIERLVPNLGACIATDRVTTRGERVGFMVREEQSSPEDSGWVFMAGTESQEYLDNPDNSSIFDLNTIANLDREVIPFLGYSVGTEVERCTSGKLEVVNRTGPPPITFLLPALPGCVRATPSWSFEASSRLLRRVEEGSLVLWRPNFTIWLNDYSDSLSTTPEKRLARIRTNISYSSRSHEYSSDGGIVRFRYFLSEECETGSPQQACYLFALTDTEELHLSIYYDDPNLEPEISRIWSTVAKTTH